MNLERTRERLHSLGLPGTDPRECPSSQQRFPDGAAYRIEIPSTEGPRALQAVIDEAHARKFRVDRISQGSGIMLLTDAEIREMVAHGRARVDGGKPVRRPAGDVRHRRAGV